MQLKMEHFCRLLIIMGCLVASSRLLQAEEDVEVIKDAVEDLKVAVDATEKFEVPETRENPVKEISHLPGGFSSNLKDTSLCGDGWTPYNDEKCLKIVDTLEEWEDAVRTCQMLNSESNFGSPLGLMTIKTREEQEFLRSFLFAKNKIVDNVWLGLRKNEKHGEFVWNDDSEVTFYNWANQTLANVDENRCTEITPGGRLVASGLWLTVSCKKKNLVVCEKRPTWTLETLQNAFMNYKLAQREKFITKEMESERKYEDLKRELEKIREEKKKELKDVKKKIDILEQTTVPVGFIYIELPGQAPPFTLWPSTNWMDVSSAYAGLFFRVVGGQAAPFGQIQEANTSRLEGVNHQSKLYVFDIVVPPDGSWSETIYSGSNTGVHCSLRFRMSKSEIRPRNQAVKLWKRIS